MKANGTFKTTIAKIGEIEVPALIVGHFAIHYLIKAQDNGYASYIEPGNPAAGMEKIERWVWFEDKTCLNVSHVNSGYLVYHPRLINCKGINKASWLKALKKFCKDIEPMADWDSKQPLLKDDIAFLRLKNALPQGELDPF